jgi:23S rRNA (adenine2503-C2)-methyltransferase
VSLAVLNADAASQTAPEDGPVNFYGFSRDALVAELKERFDAPAYRATQLFNWVYRNGVTDFAHMTNISADLRDKLAAHFVFPKAATRERQISADGTRKYLFEVDGGDLVESVMIKQVNRMTLCVSSQVGCGMGCKFCRTATMGFRRHLHPSEILMQVLGVLEDAKNFGDTFQNIVFMGMGEPLHNFDGVSTAVRILTDQQGLEISGRRITVSTVGLVPAIKKFGATGVPANLAVSLNATTDEIRSQVMPVNNRFSIDELLGAIRELPLGPRKSVTIEYVMLHGINDSEQDMQRLPKILEGLQVKVNLIPYNDNAGLGFQTPPRPWVFEWRDYMLRRGLNCTIRWSKGVDIKAACGQLVTTTGRKTHAALADAGH